MSALTRFRDWRHERHIQHLADACKEACAAGDKAKARHFWQAMADAIKARSPAQVERMDREIMKHSGSLGSR